MKLNKKYIISLSLLLIGLTISAKDKVISTADALIKERKYASAFEYLDENDPNNNEPELVIAKVNLLINYFVKTDNFQNFGLKDLLPKQSLDELRKEELHVRIIDFKPDSVLLDLSKRHPTNYKLHKALGNYYYETYLEFEDNWIESDSVLIEKFKYFNQTALKHGEFDYWSLFELGYAYLLQDNFEEAVSYLSKSVDLNKNYALSHYNLACAYHHLGNVDMALKHASNAFRLETIDEYKAEAARLLAISFEEKEEYEKALDYYKKSNEIIPNDYNTLLAIMNIDLIIGDRDYNLIAEQLIRMAPSNAAIYQDILKAYSEHNHEVDFVEFMDNIKIHHRANNSAMANIYLHQAIVQYDLEEWVAAKINFEKSRNLFRNFYSSDHSVFRVIDSYTQAIRKQI